MDETNEVEESVNMVIDGVLDLHAFSPKDLNELIPEYLFQCHALGIFQLRLIHGKGIGNLRRSVHALLARNPLVEGFRLADGENGSWGATVVLLKRQPQSEEYLGGSIE